MAKNKNDYFNLIEHQVEFCVKASDLLESIICDYSVDGITSQKNDMHEIERQADDLHHDILSRLSAEFITPIDQEDILRLVQLIDDITDAIDEVVLDFYMYSIDRMPEEAPALSSSVNKCVKALYSAVKELKNFKKPHELRKLLVEVNTVESEADTIYADALHRLFGGTESAKELISGNAIYESLEGCCDLCESVAEVIEQVIIKNT